MRFLWLALACVWVMVGATAAYATPVSQVPVLDDGRVKPLQSYARSFARDISGRDHRALDILAMVFFDPAFALKQPVFYLDDKLVKEHLGLPVAQKDFTILEIRAHLRAQRDEIIALSQESKGDLGPEQERLLAVYDRFDRLDQAMRAFSALLPLSLDLPEKYADVEPHYLALSTREAEINADIRALLDAKGEAVETYTEQEHKLVQLGYSLQQFTVARKASNGVGVIPVFTQGEDKPTRYVSIWALIDQGLLTAQAQPYLDYWQSVAEAYRSRDVNGDQAWRNVPYPDASAVSWRMGFENLYNVAQPFNVALVMYAVALVMFLFFPRKVKYAVAIMAGALIAHGLGIVGRIIVLERPPVGTLYESVLFVAWVSAALGVMFKSVHYMRPAGAASAGFLLAIAPMFLGSGDSMEMLVAVLNTNFWLTVHVLTITAGYGVCIIAACLAHFAMVPRYTKALFQPVFYLSVIALLLTAVGTALGGIWADQSWGRFWGWDPKENGALLIVLWIIWLHHGRHGGKLKKPAFLAGIATLNVVVALAWFGVNLLSVGLHSYGFTSGLASTLGAFCVAQLGLVGYLWRRYK